MNSFSLRITSVARCASPFTTAEIIPARQRHLPAGELIVRVRIQPRIEHLFNLRLLRKPFAQSPARCCCAFHPQASGTHSAQRQKTAEGSSTPPMAFCRYPNRSASAGLSPTTASPATNAGMAVQVFGGGVHYDIKTQLQRTVNDRRGEGVIRHAYHVMAAGNGPDGCGSASFSSRLVGVSTQIMRVWGTNGGFQRGQIVGLYPADPQPGAALAPRFNQTVGAAIHVINGDDMAVFIQQLQYGGNGGQTGGKSITRVPPSSSAMAVSSTWRVGLPLREYS